MASTTLRHLLGSSVRGESALVGVEHEFQTHVAGGQRDFRLLLDAIAGPVRVADPGDPRARRLSSGLALTADGWEAELVTPPVPLNAGAPRALARMLEAETACLHRALASAEESSSLTGFSTHINVSVADSSVVQVAQEFASRCAAAAMLLLERPGSPGLLVRPRRGRLEIGGEYACGDDLSAVVTFVAAAVAHLSAVAERSAPTSSAPLPAGCWGVEPARERFGYFVPADGVATDFFALGRRAELRCGGAHVSGQEHLESVWQALRPAAISLGLDPSPVDRRVAGSSPLPLEQGRHSRVPDPVATGAALELLDPAAQARQRGSLIVEPAWLTWTTVAWRCVDTERGRSVHLVIPASAEASFLELLDAGRLDHLLRRSLRRRLRRPVLTNSSQSSRPGVWSGVRPESLVPAERGPDGRPMSGGPGEGSGSRTKERRDESDAAAPRRVGGPGPPHRRLWAGLAAAAVLALVGGGVAIALSGSGETPDSAETAAPVTDPGATETATTQTATTETAGSEPTQAETPAGLTGESVEFVGTFTSVCDEEAVPPCDGAYIEDDVQATLSCQDPQGQVCTLTLDGLQGSWSALPTLTRIGATAFAGDGLSGCGRPETVTVDLVGPTLQMEQVGESDPPSCWSGTNTFEGGYVAGGISGWAP